MRATLLRLGKQEHVLLLVFHHIAFDAWSARVFVDEFAHLYRALTTGTSPALPDPPIQYADFAHWQRQRLGGDATEMPDAWMDKCLQALEFVVDRHGDALTVTVPTFRATRD